MKYIRIYILLFWIFASFSLFAQGVNLPTSGHIDTTASHIVIYDDGGPNGNHSFTCNGSITVHTSSPGKCWRILVHNSLSNYFEVRLKVNTGTLDDLTSNTYANLYDSKQADCQSGAYLGSSYQYNYLTYTNETTHKIIRDKKGFYSIYDLETKQKFNKSHKKKSIISNLKTIQVIKILIQFK